VLADAWQATQSNATPHRFLSGQLTRLRFYFQNLRKMFVARKRKCFLTFTVFASCENYQLDYKWKNGE